MTIDSDLPSTWVKRTVLVGGLMLAGAATAGGVATTQEPIYTAEARLSVGESSLSASMIPGFALATQQIASNYSRYVSTGPVLNELPPAIADDVRTVAASPIPESNIIRIEATASTANAARKAADAASTLLNEQVKNLGGPKAATQVLTEYRALSKQVATLQQKVNLAQRVVDKLTLKETPDEAPMLRDARQELIDLSAQLSATQIQQSALGGMYSAQINSGPIESTLHIVSSATSMGSNATSRLEMFAFAGGALGGTLGLLIAQVLAARPGRKSRWSTQRLTDANDRRLDLPLVERSSGSQAAR